MIKYSYFMDDVILSLLVLCCARGYGQVSCPTGDTAGIISNGQTCSELVTSSTASCYDTATEAACCASCNAANTGVTGCEYGDRETCFSFLCSTLVNTADCCATCAADTTTSPATTISSTVPTTATIPEETTITSTLPTTVTTISSTEPTPPTTVLTTTTTQPPTTTTTSAPGVTSTTTTTAAIATTTTLTSVTTTTATSPGLMGSSSKSDGNTDAAIIGGTIGGVVGLALIIAGVVCGVYFWKKYKDNKVGAKKNKDLHPKSGNQHVPEVLLPMEPVNQPTKISGIGTQSRTENGLPRTVIYDDAQPPEYTDKLVAGNQNGPKVINKPHLLPPLDTSRINTSKLVTGPGHVPGSITVNGLTNATNSDGMEALSKTIDQNGVSAHVIRPNESDVKFLIPSDNILPNK